MSLIFDQLRISDDGKRMYINIHVDTADYFKDIYLDSLTIMTADKVLETNPYQPTEDAIYNKVFEGEQKEASLVLMPMSMNEKFSKCNFSSDLFFVYVKVKGIPSECTPCGLDEETTLGVTFDDNMLYQKVMQFTKSLTDNCQTPKDFIDFILLWNAFKASVETEHYIPAYKFWQMLFGMGTPSVFNPKPCGCHG